jgi:DNA-3-methyladenine glycosylase
MMDSISPALAAAEGPVTEHDLRQVLLKDVKTAAASLLGCRLTRYLPAGRIIRAEIVETEAYHMCEPGCHAHRGQTPRTAAMFGPPGHAYVYFTYGMWHCLNVVCEPVGTAAAVLLRAAACDDPMLRMSGPGLLCQALQITREHNGINLLDPTSELRLERPADWVAPPTDWTTRIGLSFPDTYPWRAVWKGHPAVSPGRPGVIVGRKKKTALGEGRSRLERKK